MGNPLGIFHYRYGKWQSIARFLFDIFVRPLSKQEESSRKEFILNVVLLVQLAVLCFFAVIVVHNFEVQGNAYHGVPLQAFFAIFGFIVFLYLLSRRGYYLASSYLFVGILFLGNFSGIYHWGIDVPEVLLSEGFLVVMTGILINSQASLIMALAIGASLNIVGHYQISGIIKTSSHWRTEFFTQRDAMEFSFYFLLITAISWLANREINRSMHRAFRSERELLRHQGHLEELVEKRTMQLREVQVQRIDQLYRFAEFGKLASGFFHDLSNPLATLQLYLGDIQSQEDIQKAASIASNIEAFTRSMKRQLQDTSDKQRFSIADEIKNVTQLMNHRLLISNVALSIICNECAFVYGNPLRFHQVMLNLFTNAIDAYEDAVPGTEKKIDVHVSCEANKIKITVRDYGSGLTEEVRGKIFEPFFTTKSIETNMGIGLATTKNVVEKDFAGTISAQIPEGSGVLFVITMQKHND